MLSIFTNFIPEIKIISPLLEFFHMSPKDLWSNTDMFYKQIEQHKSRDRRATKIYKSKDNGTVKKESRRLDAPSITLGSIEGSEFSK